MPKLRESAEQRANRRFREALAAGLAREELTQTQLAAKLNCTTRTMSAYKAAPAKLTIAKLRTLYKAGIITAEDVTSIICY